MTTLIILLSFVVLPGIVQAVFKLLDNWGKNEA
jgi:hypothetical protein